MSINKTQRIILEDLSTIVASARFEIRNLLASLDRILDQNTAVADVTTLTMASAPSNEEITVPVKAACNRFFNCTSPNDLGVQEVIEEVVDSMVAKDSKSSVLMADCRVLQLPTVGGYPIRMARSKYEGMQLNAFNSNYIFSQKNVSGNVMKEEVSTRCELMCEWELVLCANCRTDSRNASIRLVDFGSLRLSEWPPPIVNSCWVSNPHFDEMAAIDILGQAMLGGTCYSNLWPSGICRESLDVTKEFSNYVGFVGGASLKNSTRPARLQESQLNYEASENGYGSSTPSKEFAPRCFDPGILCNHRGEFIVWFFTCLVADSFGMRCRLFGLERGCLYTVRCNYKLFKQLQSKWESKIMSLVFCIVLCNCTTTTKEAKDRTTQATDWNWKRVITWDILQAEGIKVGYLAGPLVAVTLSQYLLQAISTLMVGHLGELALYSASMATSFTAVTGFSLLLGMASGLETVWGQSYEAQQYQKLGHYLYSSVISLVTLCLPLRIWFHREKLFILVGQDPLISHEAGTYAIRKIPALFAFVFLQSIVRFLQTQSLVVPMLLSSAAVVGLHIPLCWVLVYKSGFGTVGATLTIGISYWVKIISPYHLYLNPTLVVRQYEFWCLITNFLYFRKLDLDFLFHMFFLASYCKLLEENSFRGRTVDFFYMLLFGATVLTGIVLVGGMIPYVSESFATIFFLSNSHNFHDGLCMEQAEPLHPYEFLGPIYIYGSLFTMGSLGIFCTCV